MIQMHTWDIAKLLLEHCDSRQDVDRVLLILNDTSALRELCVLLSEFATRPDPHESSTIEADRLMEVPETQQRPKGDGLKPLPDASKATMSEQLESLFRSYGMTNNQVEQWFSSNFEINVPIGKGSLKQYLLKVLKEVNLGLGNRILATAQSHPRGDLSKTSDIKEYWDQLDKQFSGVE